MLIPRAFCADKPGNKMPLPRPPRRPPPSLRLPPARLAAAVLLLALGCAHPEAARPREPDATLRICNLTDFEWVVALQPVEAESPRPSPAAWRLPPRTERIVSVAAGTYRFRQSFGDTNAGELAASDAAADAPITLRPGRTYTWPLATLLSEQEPPAP